MRRWPLAFAAFAALSFGSSALAQEAADEGEDVFLVPAPVPEEAAFDPLEAQVPPTAEEELGNAWSPAFDIAGDLRLEGASFGASNGALGVRVLLEGQHFGFDGGLSGVFVHVPKGGKSLVANGLLDLQLTFAPLSGSRGRIRLEAGLGAVFTPWVSAIGPDLGASGELRLFGPFGLAGAVRTVFWPYRSLDWNAGFQISLGGYHVRLGIRRVSVAVEGLDGGRPQTFVGPWVGAGLRR